MWLSYLFMRSQVRVTTQAVLFQHVTRITGHAAFFDKNRQIKVVQGNRGIAQVYRKGLGLSYDLCVSMHGWSHQLALLLLHCVSHHMYIHVALLNLWMICSRGQVDPSVYVKAFQSCLGACSVPLAANETLVILTGGTPEAVVDGVAVGPSSTLRQTTTRS
jgi:hypothetical protein